MLEDRRNAIHIILLITRPSSTLTETNTVENNGRGLRTSIHVELISLRLEHEAGRKTDFDPVGRSNTIGILDELTSLDTSSRNNIAEDTLSLLPTRNGNTHTIISNLDLKSSRKISQNKKSELEISSIKSISSVELNNSNITQDHRIRRITQCTAVITNITPETIQTANTSHITSETKRTRSNLNLSRNSRIPDTKSRTVRTST